MMAYRCAYTAIALVSSMTCLGIGGLLAKTLLVYTPLYRPLECINTNAGSFDIETSQNGEMLSFKFQSNLSCQNLNQYMLQAGSRKPGVVMFFPRMRVIGSAWMLPTVLPPNASAELVRDLDFHLSELEFTKLLYKGEPFQVVVELPLNESLHADILGFPFKLSSKGSIACGFAVKLPMSRGPIVCANSMAELSIPSIRMKKSPILEINMPRIKLVLATIIFYAVMGASILLICSLGLYCAVPILSGCRTPDGRSTFVEKADRSLEMQSANDHGGMSESAALLFARADYDAEFGRMGTCEDLTHKAVHETPGAVEIASPDKRKVEAWSPDRSKMESGGSSEPVLKAWGQDKRSLDLKSTHECTPDAASRSEARSENPSPQMDILIENQTGKLSTEGSFSSTSHVRAGADGSPAVSPKRNRSRRQHPEDVICTSLGHM